jgi:hypothetical protein
MERSEIRGGIEALWQSRITLRSIRSAVGLMIQKLVLSNTRSRRL